MSDLRVLSTGLLPTADLHLYGRNPRRGDVDVIADSLRTNGQFRPIVVNLGTLTGKPYEVLAGNHTLKAALKLGWDTIYASTVDVDADAAARIVAVDNRSADLGSYEDDVLLQLLQDLPSLDGTGYDQEALLALMGEDDLPDFGDDPEDEAQPKLTLTIDCTSTAQQRHVYESLIREGYAVRSID